MIDILIFTLFIVSAATIAIATSKCFSPWIPKKKKKIYGVGIIASLVFMVSIVFLSANSNCKKSVLVEDKMYIPLGYIYVWNAKTIEESIQRQETRYYLIVQKSNRLVEERVDSATYAKARIGQRITMD